MDVRVQATKLVSKLTLANPRTIQIEQRTLSLSLSLSPAPAAGCDDTPLLSHFHPPSERTKSEAAPEVREGGRGRNITSSLFQSENLAQIGGREGGIFSDRNKPRLRLRLRLRPSLARWGGRAVAIRCGPNGGDDGTLSSLTMHTVQHVRGRMEEEETTTRWKKRRRFKQLLNFPPGT